MHGQSFGPYAAVQTLGDGGTGIVLRCVHAQTGQVAAVKIPKARERSLEEALRREIAVIGSLNRVGVRGIVQLIEHGARADVPWYAMDFVEGQSLRHWNDEHWAALRSRASEAHTPAVVLPTLDVGGSLPPPPPPSRRPRGPSSGAASSSLEHRAAVVRMLVELLETLDELHDRGVVHGDVTPANVVVRKDGTPVLIDFGTALVEPRFDPRTPPYHEAVGRGTPGYIAPEVIQGEPPDARSDLYAIGSVMFELLLGRSAFAAEHPSDILREQLERSDPPVATWPDELQAIEALVAALLQRDPTRRPARASDALDVLHAHLDGKPARTAQRRPPRLYRARFVGRREAIAESTAALEHARCGSGKLLLVSSPAGLGKTRFLQELSRVALRAGCEVVWCRASRPSADATGTVLPTEALQLFRPLLERIAQAVEACDPRLAGDEPLRALQHLRPIVPWLRVDLHRPPLEPVDDAVARALGAFAKLVCLFCAARKGLVVLIDDLEWADAVSVDFIRTHLDALRAAGVLIVASHRSDARLSGLSDSSEAADSRFQLEPLRAHEISALAKEVLSTRQLPEGLTEFLRERSSGNPFFIIEYLRSASSCGLLRREAGAWTSSLDSLDELPLPRSIGEVSSWRLHELSPTARAALPLASVLGRELDAHAFEVAARGEFDARGALEELVSKELLAPVQNGRYRFAHDQFREAQLSSIEPSARRELHRRIAELLEAQDMPSADERLASLGYHWSSAGEPSRALGYLEAAAAAAQSAHSLERAAGLYRLALAQVQGREHVAKRTLLGEALGDVLLRQARHRAARSALRKVLAELPRAQRLARARVCRKIAASHYTTHEYAAASRWLNRAERDLTVSRNAEHSLAYGVELVQARLGRFQQLYFAGQLGEELDRLVADLGPLVEAHGTNEQRCSYYFTAASHRLLRSRYAFDAEALALARHGLRAAEEKSAEQVAMAHFVLAWTLMSGSETYRPLSLPHFEVSARQAQQLGDMTLLARVRIYHAIALLRLGDVESVATTSALALEAAEAAQLQPYVAGAHACNGWVAWRRAALDEAVERLKEARSLWHAHPHKFPFSNIAIFPLVDIAEAKGELSAVGALLAELDTGLPALPNALRRLAHDVQNAIAAGTDREAAASARALVRMARAEGFA